MDIQYERNLEQFFRLLGHWPVQLDERMEYHRKPYGLMVEWFKGQVLLTSWLLEFKEEPDLAKAIGRLLLPRFFGLPQRLFIIEQRLMISTSMPAASEARDWYQLCLAQRKFLASTRGGCL